MCNLLVDFEDRDKRIIILEVCLDDLHFTNKYVFESIFNGISLDRRPLDFFQFEEGLLRGLDAEMTHKNQ